MSPDVGRRPPRIGALEIRHAKSVDAAAILSFHTNNAGEYLWPRTREQIDELIENWQLFVLLEDGDVAGLCYVTQDPQEEEHWEFGGIFVAGHLRGRGLAAALGRVAIASAYVADPPGQLIAHVHEHNQDPRGLLMDQLGFEDTGRQDVIPDDEAPRSMRRTGPAGVAGDVFEFRRPALADFADWLESFEGAVASRTHGTPVSIVEAVAHEPAQQDDLRTLAGA